MLLRLGMALASREDRRGHHEETLVVITLHLFSADIHVVKWFLKVIDIFLLLFDALSNRFEVIILHR